MLFGHISAWVPGAAATELLSISAFVTCTGAFGREQIPGGCGVVCRRA